MSLQKLVGKFFLFFCRDVLGEVWREFCCMSRIGVSLYVQGSLTTNLRFLVLGLSGHQALSGTLSHPQRTQSGVFRQNQALSGKIWHFQAFSGHDFA